MSTDILERKQTNSQRSERHTQTCRRGFCRSSPTATIANSGSQRMATVQLHIGRVPSSGTVRPTGQVGRRNGGMVEAALVGIRSRVLRHGGSNEESVGAGVRERCRASITGSELPSSAAKATDAGNERAQVGNQGPAIVSTRNSTVGTMRNCRARHAQVVNTAKLGIHAGIEGRAVRDSGGNASGDEGVHHGGGHCGHEGVDMRIRTGGRSHDRRPVLRRRAARAVASRGTSMLAVNTRVADRRRSSCLRVVRSATETVVAI